MIDPILDKHENLLIKDLLDTIKTEKYLNLQKKNAIKIVEETELLQSKNHKRQEEIKLKINFLNELKKDLTNIKNNTQSFSKLKEEPLKTLTPSYYPSSFHTIPIQPLKESDLVKLTNYYKDKQPSNSPDCSYFYL